VPALHPNKTAARAGARMRRYGSVSTRTWRPTDESLPALVAICYASRAP
jgi:hypothetical protein